MTPYTTRTTCRSCKAESLQPVLSLGMQALPGFVKEVRDDHPRAPLDLVQCSACGLLQLQHETDMELLCRDYWYRSSINQTMRDALADVVLDGSKFAREGVWLDIGANDGLLLSRVGERFTKVGCEPALNMLPLLEEHADRVIPEFFNAEDYLDGSSPAEVITSCACFYHVSDPDRFVADITRCLAPGGVWINQLSDAPTMLRLNAFDAICHEHACYYDVHDLKRIYDRHGLSIVSIKHNAVNGGSVRVAAVKTKNVQTNSLAGVAEVLPEDVEGFKQRVIRWKDTMTNLLESAFDDGDVWCLGASTKGDIALQYLDQNKHLVAIADRNPAKHGLFQAGSGLPITDEATFRKAKPKYALNMIWAFRDEVLLRESALRKSGTIFVNVLPNIELVI